MGHNKTIKVCHMTSVHQSNDVRIFQKECVSLASAGYDVYLVSPGESREDRGVHVIGVGKNNAGRLSRMFRFTKKVYKTALSIDADIYHFHDPELLPIGLKLKRLGKKVIFDSHEFTVRQIRIKPYLNPVIAKIIAEIYGVYERYVMRRIDGVVCPCLIDEKNPFENVAKNVALVDNYPLLNEFYDHYNSNIEKKYATCYVGSLTEERGITDCIKAAYEAGVSLALAGPFGSSKYRNYLESMPEYDCVDYKGVLDRKSIMELIQSTSIGLCVLRNIGQYRDPNNLSTKVYEYISLGVPVILSNAPYNIKIANEFGFAVCVTPSNSESIKDAILGLLAAPDKRDELGQCGRAAVKDFFNWDVAFSELLNLYQTVLSGNNE